MGVICLGFVPSLLLHHLRKLVDIFGSGVQSGRPGRGGVSGRKLNIRGRPVAYVSDIGAPDDGRQPENFTRRL
jgi:hypothetical protein